MLSEKPRVKVPHQVAEAGFQMKITGFGEGFNPSLKKYRKKVAGAIPIGQAVEIETREGWLKAEKGDYLVANNDDLTFPWPVKKEIFEKTYEEWKEVKP